ncbi:hypothetical protein DV738_g5167, partial [Chaetothyriales sp. CBS 135597]
MSPLPTLNNGFRTFITRDSTQDEQSQKPTDPNGLVLEAWAEGFMIGALGVFILFNPPIYGWWLSVAAIPLNGSWVLHNVISWMKLKPFMTPFWSRLFIGTVLLSIPYWITEIYANFAFFHQINNLFLKTRPFEALCRDPWWIITTVALMYNIKTKYELTIAQIVRISPRFAVMLGSMFLSVCFIILDVLSVTAAFKSTLPVGINPFWKLAFVFKCLTDAVVLDDFKTALDRLRAFKVSRLGSFAIDANTAQAKEHRQAVMNANGWGDPPTESQTPLPVSTLPPMPTTPEAERLHPRWSEIKHGHTDHLEHGIQQEWADLGRAGSRDRDDEENPIQRARLHDETNKTNSDSHALRHQVSWQATSSSSDVELEYAQAVREISAGPSSKRTRDIDR